MCANAEILQRIIDRCGYRAYLEIGCQHDTTFRRLKSKSRTGVDPVRGGTHRLTSDRFFQHNTSRFDLVFVDGLHERGQAVRDVDNALKILSPGGCIVLHDCLPKTKRQQQFPPPPERGPWTGDVWKAVVDLRRRPTLDVATLDEGWGFGLVFARPNGCLLELESEALTWADYQTNQARLLRIITLRELNAFLAGSRSIPACLAART